MLDYGEDFLIENDEALKRLRQGMTPAAIELAAKTAPRHATADLAVEEDEFEAAA